MSEALLASVLETSSQCSANNPSGTSYSTGHVGSSEVRLRIVMNTPSLHRIVVQRQAPGTCRPAFHTPEKCVLLSGTAPLLSLPKDHNTYAMSTPQHTILSHRIDIHVRTYMYVICMHSVCTCECTMYTCECCNSYVYVFLIVLYLS